MGLVSIVIIEGLVEDTTDLDAIRDTALDRCHDSAENRNIYDSWVLENLYQYRRYEPQPSEVACHLSAEALGDWRAVAKMSAVLATRAHLEAEADEDLGVLERAFDECQQNSYDVTAIRGFCPNGWAVHKCETSWQSGTLHEWPRLEGGEDSVSLRVALSGTSEVWLELSKSA